MGILPRYAIRVASSVIALSLRSTWGAEPEWPRFRGPDANPVVAKGRLPEKWSKTENVEWVAEIAGRGWSSPIVNGSNVFVTTVTTEGKSKTPQIGTEYSNEYVAELMKQGLSEQEVLKRVTARDIELPKEVMLHYYLYCLDIQTGKVVWKREFYSGQPPGGRHRKNSFASETPVTDGNLVYVYVANLGLYAYDMKGTQVWHMPLEAYPIYLDFGTGGSPALLGDLLLIVNDNEKQQFIAAFDTKTGKPVWRTNRDLAAKGDGPPQRSGWVTRFVWKNPPRGGTYLPTEVAYDGALYVLSETGILSRIDAKTGKLSYRSRLDAGGAFTSSPWAYNGKVFCLSEEGKTFVIAASEKFELIRINLLEEMAQATPAIVGDRLLLRTESRLYSIRNRN